MIIIVINKTFAMKWKMSQINKIPDIPITSQKSFKNTFLTMANYFSNATSSSTRTHFESLEYSIIID